MAKPIKLGKGMVTQQRKAIGPIRVIFTKLQEICADHGLELDTTWSIWTKHSGYPNKRRISVIWLGIEGVCFGTHRDNQTETIPLSDPQFFYKIEQIIQHMAVTYESIHESDQTSTDP